MSKRAVSLAEEKISKLYDFVKKPVPMGSHTQREQTYCKIII